MERKLYAVLASSLVAYKNCAKQPTNEWQARHAATIESLVKEFMPSGSGLDNGTKFHLEESGEKKLVFTTSYHHMNEHGYYDGWTDHSVVVTPAFDGIDVRVTGRDRNGVKEYIGEIFHDALYVTIDDQTLAAV